MVTGDFAVKKRFILAALARVATLPLVLALASAPVAGASADPLASGVPISSLALHSPMVSIASQGARVVAVGPRGYILFSANGGKDWRQATVPVRADLTAVHLRDARNGWAVGHDGVVLRTDNGGESWTRILDGRSVLEILNRGYEARAAAGDTVAARVKGEIERLMAQSASPDVMPNPFLDVLFSDASEGFVIGAFGLVLRTRDGGKNWEPWIERAENDRRLHFYAAASDGASLYFAGEQGLLRRLDKGNDHFTTIETPYSGTFFGVHAAPGLLLAYGLRGNAWASEDGGASWRKIETSVEASIIAVLPAGGSRLILVSQAGHVFSTTDGGRTLAALQVPRQGEVLAATLVGANDLALTRHGGVNLVTLPAAR